MDFFYQSPLVQTKLDLHLIAGFNCYSIIDYSSTAESKISKMSTASVLRSKLVVVGDWAVSKILIIWILLIIDYYLSKIIIIWIRANIIRWARRHLFNNSSTPAPPFPRATPWPWEPRWSLGSFFSMFILSHPHPLFFLHVHCSFCPRLQASWSTYRTPPMLSSFWS